MNVIHFVYPINNLGCFFLLVIVNNEAINRGVQLPVLSPTLISFGHKPRGGIVGLYVNSV